MNLEILMPTLISFAQSFLYDISKELFSKATNNNWLRKRFKAIIEKSARSVVKYPEALIDSITAAVVFACESTATIPQTVFPDIKEIVVKELRSYDIKVVNNDYEFVARELTGDDINVNVVHGNHELVATEISSTIFTNLLRDPELSVSFTNRILSQQLSSILDMQKKLQEFQEKDSDFSLLLSRICDDIQETKATSNAIIDALQCIDSYFSGKVKAVRNARITILTIPDAYKEYFLRPLFLEHQMPDDNQVTLKDVYIENKYALLDFPFHNEGKIRTGLLNFIRDFLDDNLLQQNYGTRFDMPSTSLKLLFIKGHPGSGKSSLFYYLAYLKSHDESFYPDWEFHFIKLIDVCDKNDGVLSTISPLGDIETYIGAENLSDRRKLVFVLDGLDEICAAKDFNIVEYCVNLAREVAQYNNRLKVIVTTRLNYVDLPNRENKNVINIQLQNLDVDDLRLWVEKYFSIHKTLSEMYEAALETINFLEANRDEKYLDILAIPLLFYMIVVSKIDVSKINSVGQLYDSVFDELKQRNYNEADSDYIQKHAVDQKIPAELARQIAMEISYAMYKQSTLLLKVDSNELEQALSQAYDWDHSITAYEKKNIESLFPITFFYKRIVDVVEFAHKSIMEFFVAEKLYQSLNSCKKSMRTFINDSLLSPVVITSEVLSFFTYFVDNRDDNRIEMLATIITEFKDDIRTKRVYSCDGVSYAYETYKIVFKLYWYFIRRLVKCDVETINKFLADDSVKGYIQNVLSLVDSRSIPFLDNSVVKLDFSNLTFLGYNFFYSKLSHICFTQAEVTNCKFMFSNLSHVDFSGSVFAGWITFSSCNMEHARLDGISSKDDTTTSKTIESHVIFNSCNFEYATFANLDIRRMQFSSTASMQYVMFSNVKMTFTQFVDFSKQSIKMDNVTVSVQNADFSTKDSLEMMSLSETEKHKKMIRLTNSRMNSKQKKLLTDGYVRFDFEMY